MREPELFLISDDLEELADADQVLGREAEAVLVHYAAFDAWLLEAAE